jgi:membrane associated rhomboid family serine protease
MSPYYRPTGSPFGFNLGITPAVKALLAANLAVFVLTGFLGMDLARRGFLGLTPALVVKGMIWQPVTYLFLHADLGHILFNMLSLWMFGTAIEGAWGRQRFLRFYFWCGIGSGLCVTVAGLLSREIYTTTIGASGAIMGVLVAFAVLYPNVPVWFMLLFPIPAKYFVLLIGAITFYSARSGSGGNVSHAAHLGGLLIGYLLLRWGRGGYTSAWSYSGSTRRSRLSKLFSLEEWRIAYRQWQIRRRRKQFEVYLRKHGGNDRVN